MEAAEDQPTDWALVAIRLFICIAGILGNLLVIFVILILKEYKKTVTHWYVLQLAVADSAFLLTLPFKVSEQINRRWIYTAGMCKAKETVLFINYYASILFLVIMSIDRYIAVCHAASTKLQKFRTPKFAHIITVSAWIAALIMCIPVMMYSDKRGELPDCSCSYHFPEHHTDEDYCISQGYTAGSSELKSCVDGLQAFKRPACAAPLNFTDIVGSVDYEFSGGDIYDYLNTFLEKESNLTYDDSASVAASVSGVNTEKSYHVGCIYLYQGPGWAGFLLYNFIVMFWVPLGIMVFCYAMIINRIQKTKLKTRRTHSFDASTNSSVTGTEIHNISSSKRKTKRKKSAAQSRANSERNRVTIMCAVLVVTFLVCWLPFHSVHMALLRGMDVSKENAKWCSLLPKIASLIIYMNSALNPYLYNFLGTKFGRRIRDATKSVKYSVRKRTTSFGSSRRSQNSTTEAKNKKAERTNSNDPTMTTKIYKGSIHQTEVNAVEMPTMGETSKLMQNHENQTANNQQNGDQRQAKDKEEDIPPPVYRADTNTFETPTKTASPPPSYSAKDDDQSQTLMT